jgi:hypothetical protein
LSRIRRRLGIARLAAPIKRTVGASQGAKVMNFEPAFTLDDRKEFLLISFKEAQRD